MMESCLNLKPEKVGIVTAEDIRKDLSSYFSKLSKDTVMQEKEHLQVYLRVRPFTTSERAEGESQECISIEPPDTVILKAHKASLTARHSERFGSQQAQRFQFSQVYGPDTTQREIFDGTTKSLVKDVLDGGNSLIFTYGVTNAGKTFTFLGPDSDCGILPRSLDVIFKSIEGRIYSQNSIKPHRCVDFIELTKEQQDEEATDKRNLLQRFKDIDPRKTLSSMSSSSFSLFESSTFSDTNRDSVCLDDTSNVKFSVWVSFCEIYNENIHDLLDVVPNGSHRRNVLRLAQDEGNAFVKDLKWVQVNSAEEALKVVKIGRKNQSSSSTKLNNVSSRSHSIFSIRILRIEDVGVPRVQTISELSLCDLAGSERCAKTQNQGDRLKEAGNINTSLLTLGKCINALRLNQMQPKIHQHIPFRESKLTHYFQSFFCGRGKACMIININQCASVYDETLNVLKFSALAQKVVVLNPKPAPSIAVKRSDRGVSTIISNADKKDWTRRSSFMGWEMNLEEDNVHEDKDDEEMGEEDNESMEDNIVLDTVESQKLFEHQLNEKLSNEESEKLTMESRMHMREEVMELFFNMEKDNKRLQRQKEIVEERRLERQKNLVNRTIGEMATVCTDGNAAKEDKIEHLDSMIKALRDDLAKIKGDAESVQICLTNVPESSRTISDLRTQLEEMREELIKSQQLLSLKTIELEAMCVQMQELDYQLLQANRNYENKKLRCQELMSVCQEKNGRISTLQTVLDQNVEAAAKDALNNNIKQEILNFRNNCKCGLNEDGEPRGEEMTSQETQQLLQELNIKDEQLNELKLERCSLEKKVCDLADRLAEQTHAHEATVAMERAEVNKVTTENQVLANELHVLQQSASEMSSKLKTLQTELSTQTKIANELSEELDAAKTLIKEHRAEYCSQSKSTESLMMEADHLRQELSARQLSHDKIQAEFERMVELSHKKSRRINDLEQEVSQTRTKMCQLEELCSRLKYERDAQDKLIKLNQHEELQNIVRLIVETEIFEVREKAKRKITAMEKDLAHKDAEIETKAQELSKVSELVDDGRNKIQTLSYDLQQVQRERADVRDQLCEANIQKEQLEKQILILSEENKMFQQRLCEANEMRDQAGHSLSCTEQSVDPQQTVKSNHVIGEESLQPFQTTCQDLLAEQKLFEETCGNLNKCTQTDEEELLEARLNEIKSITEDLAQLQEMYQKPNVGVSVEPQQDEQRACRPAENRKPNEELADDKQEKELDGAAKGKVALAARQLEGDQQDSLQLELEILKQKLAEKQDTTVKLQREKDDLAVSCKAVTQKVDHPKQTSKVALLDNSTLSKKSLREESFTKTGLKFTITPLKPDQMNVRKPGEEKPVRKKLRSTARKRKSPELESSVESENRKTQRLKVNNRENIQFIETPVVQGKKVTRLKQKDSVSLKGKKDRALNKIGDFIQSSPTIFGSKAKKIMSMVNVKSPKLNPSENNKPKISKRKLFKFSSPLDIPSHPIIGSSDDDQDSSHFIIKRKLRTRTAKSKCKH
ncbi:kinesin-like protein KIF20B isoform X2 [Carassius carassius]|uniref:kinesin-like protein KIF20B isoform X2 n=1 Tax=Carassius carassius TaxID=217509 RepID=UPI0028691F48|nr:kinesin-like protein KIF20B isoform X2 [Carassius carassius]